MDLKDLKRAAKELEERMKLCSDLSSFEIDLIPEDMKIVLKVYFKDGRISERAFQRKDSKS